MIRNSETLISNNHYSTCISRTLEVLFIIFTFYKFVVFLKGTKAFQISKGLLLLLIVIRTTETIDFHVVSWLVNGMDFNIIIILFVIFQPETRRGLEHLGRAITFKNREIKNVERLITALDEAIQHLSKRKIGALITVERNTGLDEYTETGVLLNAVISSELLITLFSPNTPLHDGAVIVKEGKVAAAGAHLPQSDSDWIPGDLGMRHRAAVGISEIGDAVTVVVSEQTGEVSLTLNGALQQKLTRDEYLELFGEEFRECHAKGDKGDDVWKHFMQQIIAKVKSYVK